MSIKKILSNADKANIADDLEESKLAIIGEWVVSCHDDDMETMRNWSDAIKEGMKVSSVEVKGKSEPWEGASNYKSPLIGEAVRDFGDRATSEILRNKDLVATEVKTKNQQLLAELKPIADRIQSHMNYQYNCEIKQWRDEQERGFYRIAAQGALIKKCFYDSTRGINNTEWIGYPNFTINNKCTSFDELDRFIHVRAYSSNDVFTKQNSGEWTDCEFEIDEECQDKKDDYYTFLECYCCYDIDGDGYDEPYIITVHKQSKKVVRIAPRYYADGVSIRYKNKTVKAVDAERMIRDEIQSNELMDDTEKEKFINKDIGYMLRDSKLVRIDPINMLTLYNFITPTDGTLLGEGFLHLMTSGVKGVNKTTNNLFDAGDLANLQGGFLSKEHRTKRKGPFKYAPGVFRDTEISSDRLANSVFPFPFKEPSATLLSLNEGLKAELKELSTKTNIGDALSPNIPAASVLGLLQEGIIPTTALIGRIVSAMSKEFEVMAELNAIYTDPQVYNYVTGSMNYDSDYASSDVVIKPTADGRFSSQAQRIQLAQVQMDNMAAVLEVGGNPIPIVKNFYEAIGSANIDSIFPPDGEMSEQEKQQLEQMKAAQQAQTEAVNRQNEILGAQLELAQQAQRLEEMKAQTKAELDMLEQQRKERETNAKIYLDQQRLIKELESMQADIIKTLEEAETESIKNQIDIYQKRFDNIMRTIDVQRA